MCCWFKHHFRLLAHLLFISWCILARVFPSKLHDFVSFKGEHVPHFPCVRTIHAPSFACCICHTVSTNKDILLAFVRNCSQGNTIRPTAATPTTNGMRSSWDLLPGRSPDTLAGPSPSTFLVLEGGLDDKLCPLILFWIFTHLSRISLHAPLHEIFCMPNLSTSRESFVISCLNSWMILKAKWPGLCTYKTYFPCLTR